MAIQRIIRTKDDWFAQLQESQRPSPSRHFIKANLFLGNELRRRVGIAID